MLMNGHHNKSIFAKDLFLVAFLFLLFDICGALTDWRKEKMSTIPNAEVPPIANVQLMRNPEFERQRAQEKRERKLVDLGSHRRPPPDDHSDIVTVEKPFGALGLLIVATSKTSLVASSNRDALRARMEELARPASPRSEQSPPPSSPQRVSPRRSTRSPDEVDTDGIHANHNGTGGPSKGVNLLRRLLSVDKREDALSSPIEGLRGWLVSKSLWGTSMFGPGVDVPDGPERDTDFDISSPKHLAALRQLGYQQTDLQQQLPMGLIWDDASVDVAWIGNYCALALGELALRRAFLTGTKGAATNCEGVTGDAASGLVIHPPERDPVIRNLDELFDFGKVAPVPQQVKEERVIRALRSFRKDPANGGTPHREEVDESEDFGVVFADHAGFEDTGVHHRFGHRNLATLEELWLKAGRYAAQQTGGDKDDSCPDEDFSVDPSDLRIDSPRSLLVCIQAGVAVESVVRPLLAVLPVKRRDAHNKVGASNQLKDNVGKRKTKTRKAPPSSMTKVPQVQVEAPRRMSSSADLLLLGSGSTTKRPRWKNTFRAHDRREGAVEDDSPVEDGVNAISWFASVGGGNAAHQAAFQSAPRPTRTDAARFQVEADPSLEIANSSEGVRGNSTTRRGSLPSPRTAAGGVGRTFLIHELAASYKTLSRGVSQKQAVYRIVKAGVRHMVDAFNVATAEGRGPVAQLHRGPATTSLLTTLESRVSASVERVASFNATTSISAPMGIIGRSVPAAVEADSYGHPLRGLDVLLHGDTSPVETSLLEQGPFRSLTTSAAVTPHGSKNYNLPSPHSAARSMLSTPVTGGLRYGATNSKNAVSSDSHASSRPHTSQATRSTSTLAPAQHLTDRSKRPSTAAVTTLSDLPPHPRVATATSCKSATPYTDLLRRRHKDLIVEWTLQQSRILLEASKEERVAAQLRNRRQERIDRARACQYPIQFRVEDKMRFSSSRGEGSGSGGGGCSIHENSSSARQRRDQRLSLSVSRLSDSKGHHNSVTRAQKRQGPKGQDCGSDGEVGSDWSVYSSCSCVDCSESRAHNPRGGSTRSRSLKNDESLITLSPSVSSHQAAAASPIKQPATVSTNGAASRPPAISELVRAQSAAREQQRVEHQLEKVRRTDALALAAAKRKAHASRARSLLQREKAAKAAEFNDRKGRKLMYTSLLLEDRNESQRMTDLKKSLVVRRERELQSEERQLKGFLASVAHEEFEKGRLHVLKDIHAQEVQQQHVVESGGEAHGPAITSSKNQSKRGLRISKGLPNARVLSPETPPPECAKAITSLSKVTSPQVAVARGTLLQHLSAQQDIINRWGALEELHSERQHRLGRTTAN